LLSLPEESYSGGLGGDAYHQEMGKLEGVVSYDRVLQRRDDCYCSIERVSKEEIPELELSIPE
jgi:hypothetical protein